MFFFKRTKNRKWQERPVLYKGRFFYLRRIAQIALVVFGVVLVLAVALYFRNSSAMLIKHVTVTGNFRHLSQEAVVALSGIKKTDMLFSAHLRQIQKNILRYPWVREVRVRREFPDTLQIHVVENEPVALLHVDDWYLINRNGQVFKKLSSDDPKDFPVISGFQKEQLVQYPTIARRSLKQCLDFLEFLNQQNFYKEDPVSEIVFDDVFGFTVFTRNQGIEVYYGKKNCEQKHELLEKFKRSAQYQAGNFVRLDLDSPGRIIGRTREVRNTFEETNKAKGKT